MAERAPAQEKACSLCGLSKPRSEFYPDRTRRDGLQSRCKECERERGRVRWRNMSAEERRRRYDYFCDLYYPPRREEISARSVQNRRERRRQAPAATV